MLGNVGVQGKEKTQLHVQFNIVLEYSRGGGHSFVCLTMHGLNFN